MTLLAGLLLSALIHPQGTTEKATVTQEDDEIGFSYEFVWGTANGFGPYVPIRVFVENPLKDDRGTVTVSSGSYKSTVPVELPSKTIRSFIVYVPTGDYEQVTLSLNCRQDRIAVTLDPLNNVYGRINLGLVSDVTSVLTFLRASAASFRDTDGQVQRLAYADFAVLPGKAPDRTIGYAGLSCLVLAEGAERLPDKEVAAIKGYVLSGGSLLFTGGAISPILRDPRWAGFLPGKDPAVVTTKSGPLMSKLAGLSPGQEIALTTLTPTKGSFVRREGDTVYTVSKSVGLGQVHYWAFDPFQSPVRNAESRAKLFETAVTNASAQEQYLVSMGVGVSREYTGAYSPFGVPTQEEEESTPFRVSIPSTGWVFFILALYFLAVVPLNFTLLGRKGKGHLIWLSAPLIGVAFAAVFFFISRGLYSKELSRATTAVVFAHQGERTAYVIGEQQYFFPSGGRYDLGLKGVEIIGPSESNDPYGYLRQRDTGFGEDVLDVGEAIAPAASVSNLTFREAHFRQTVPFPYGLPVQIEVTKERSSIRANGTLTNDSPYAMTGTVLQVGRGTIAIPDAAPGKTVSFNGMLVFSQSGRQNGSVVPNAIVPTDFRGVVLNASLKDFQTGASVGKEYGTPIRLVFSYDRLSGAPGGQ